MPKAGGLGNRGFARKLAPGTGVGKKAAQRTKPMPATPDDLFRALDALGIPCRTHVHPPLFTVEDSQKLRGTIAGAHTKNLFLKDKKGAIFLVTVEEDAVVDLKSLHHKLEAGRFSFGSADLLREVWGVEPGAVTAFGAINDTGRRVTVILDAALMRHGVINCHPLVNTMTTSIAAADLVRFLASTGHSPRIVEVSEPV
jgi:Ala-tRNA(Pro) deacylase